MRRKATVAFMIYHEGDYELDREGGVIDRVVAWIKANSQLDIIPIVKKATWDGKISEFKPASRGQPAQHHLDPGDVDQAEIPNANFVVLLWSAKQPGKPELYPAAGGLVYGPDAETFRRTGTGRSFISVPYHTFWDPLLPEGTDTTDPNREFAKAQAREKSGWYAGIDSTIIHESQNMLVATLWDKHGIKMKSTYRPQPTDPNQEWFDDSLPQWKFEPDLYRAVFAAMTPEMYEKVADPVPEPPVPTIPPGLKEKLVEVESKLRDTVDELELLSEWLIKIIESLPM